jgi:hypothetical protein
VAKFSSFFINCLCLDQNKLVHFKKHFVEACTLHRSMLATVTVAYSVTAVSYDHKFFYQLVPGCDWSPGRPQRFRAFGSLGWPSSAAVKTFYTEALDYSWNSYLTNWTRVQLSLDPSKTIDKGYARKRLGPGRGQEEAKHGLSKRHARAGQEPGRSQAGSGQGPG